MKNRHKVVCQIDGMEYPAEEMRKQWDGLIVHRRNFTVRHPQDLIRAVPDNPSVMPVNVEPGIGSSCSDDFNWTEHGREMTWNWVNHNNSQIVDHNGNFIQLRLTSGELYIDSQIPTSTFDGSL